MASPILQLSNLTKIYRKPSLGRARATVGIEGVDLEVSQGEIFALLGPNGAGKTTSLKMVLGLLFPSGGEIRLFGRRMPDREAVRNVGFLPETPSFARHFSIEETLLFYGRLSGMPEPRLRERAEEVLALVRLSRRRDRRVRECSKGMLQRLSLAQALVHDPSFLILDEPITGLDPMGLAEMRELILDLNRRGKTVLFSSHIIAEVEKIAHRVGILVGGKLVEAVGAEEWRGRPGSLESRFVKTVRAHSQDDAE